MTWSPPFPSCFRGSRQNAVPLRRSSGPSALSWVWGLAHVLLHPGLPSTSCPASPRLRLRLRPRPDVFFVRSERPRREALMQMNGWERRPGGAVGRRDLWGSGWTGAGTGEHIDLRSTCSQERTPLALILLSARPAPMVGEYKQDALMSAHKSPQVAPWPPALDPIHPPTPPSAHQLQLLEPSHLFDLPRLNSVFLLIGL